jgi:glycosyltransferase involved in cell wall biosynthesis
VSRLNFLKVRKFVTMCSDKRVMYVHSGADMYGASRSLLRLILGVRREGWDVDVVLPFSGPLQDELQRIGVFVTVLPTLAMLDRKVFRSVRILGLCLRIPISTVSLIWLIRRRNIAIVHTNTATIISTGLAARLAGAKHVWHVRESFLEFGFAWKVYARYLLWAADRIPCVSRAIADQFPADPRVVVVNDGLPLEEFPEVSESRCKAIRQQYGLGSARLVGVIGRIKFKRKGQELFVRAAAMLKGRVDNVKYVVVGSPFPGNEEHEDDLRRLIAQLELQDEVVLTGDIADIKAAFAVLDILVLPSRLAEPFGGVVLEAMASRVPVIGTRLGGTVEQIEHGVSGILVDPDDPHDLADQIESLLTDDSLRTRIGQAGRQRLEEKFLFDGMLSRLVECYETV